MLKKLKLFISMDKANTTENFLSMKELIDKQNIGDTTVLPHINPEDMAEIILHPARLAEQKE
ncbi:MAG: hypothetical protein H6613_12515 [Ignavibacteriales bacterium]|nr:hypothetical protein [Ignavibacteriales bacterium]